MGRLVKAPIVKVYHGYGHTNDLLVYGHVFKRKPPVRKNYTNNIFLNIIHLVKLFFAKPFPHVQVRLNWRGQELGGTADKHGFFKFEWRSEDELEKGWHEFTVDCVDSFGSVLGSGAGQLYVPYSTQYVLVSDIDDTVMVSHSATIFRRLRELLTKNPRTRRQFEDWAKFYEKLALSGTTSENPNPFFYVSSSEWNLYDYLDEFFGYNKFPRGIFLLSQLKYGWQMLWTGKNKHEGKLVRISRLLEVFPKQQFILLGDNSQHDPIIYTTIAKKYIGRVFAIYIRNVRKEKALVADHILEGARAAGVNVYLFERTDEAEKWSGEVGLI
jgi:phosphatidate phosphatase APP1